MGKFNSSTTRVVPVFSRLFVTDPTGASWLPGLLRSGLRVQSSSPSVERPTLIPNHAPTWGKNELSLPPPLGLLEHLVQTITEKQVDASDDDGIVLRNRQMLAKRHPDTVDLAINLLRGGARGRQWYVLEGASKPDAVLEMADAVLVIEGKRTERSCTSKTKWMGIRSQLVRHMDAASEYYRGKRILGLLIVEGAGGSDAVQPSEHWQREAAAQITSSMLEASLPHRSAQERMTLAAGMIGVTTWQNLCAEHGLPWPPAPDVLTL